MANERKYFVKSGMRTNLDTFRVRVLNARFDLLNDEKTDVEFLGEVWTIDNIDELLEEVQTLLDYACYGKVTSKEYGRIKQISEEQNWHRYNRCIESGMDDCRASYAFM